MAKPETTKKDRRKGNSPWKRILGVDRKFTARVERAVQRGQYTSPEEAK